MISVVICTYNRCESLKDTMDSLLTQECDDSFNYEIIIVDNNSRDSTKEVVESYIPKFNAKLRYIFESNQGISHARNRGINETRGEILIFVDDDVCLDQYYLNNVMLAFQNHNTKCIVGKIHPSFSSEPPKWVTTNGAYKFAGPGFTFDLGNKIRKISMEDKILPFGACMIFKKTIFQKYGFFNVNFGYKGSHLLSGEDTEFFQRILRNDEEILYFPQLLVRHKIDCSRLTKIYFSKYSFWTAYTLILLSEKKCKKNFGIPRYLIHELVSYFFQWLIFSLLFSVQRAFYARTRFFLTLGYMYGYRQNAKR